MSKKNMTIVRMVVLVLAITLIATACLLFVVAAVAPRNQVSGATVRTFSRTKAASMSGAISLSTIPTANMTAS
jgi:hypothetical protein